jgi:hypothetical protein
MPCVPALHRVYARRDGEALAEPAAGPLTLRLAGAGAGGADAEVDLELALLRAPAALARPLLAKRRLDAPFVLLLRAAADAPLRLAAGVRAHAADEAAVRDLPRWAPPAPGAGGVLNGEAAAELELREAPADADASADASASASAPTTPRRRFVAEARLELHHLALAAPSNMRPRWLLFSAFLPGAPPDAALFAHLRVPTIAMSRQADQEDKALRLLWGGAPPARALLAEPYAKFRRWVRRELSVPDVRRQLAPEELLALARRAGYVAGADGAPAPPPPPPPAAGGDGDGDAGAAAREAAAAAAARERDFVAYLSRTRAVIEAARAQYDRQGVQVICGLATGREAAAAALRGAPPGTFLLRFDQEGGALVVSLVGAAGVEHHRLLAAALRVASVEALLATNGRARVLLDARTGQRFPKESVLGLAYASGEEALSAAAYAAAAAAAALEAPALKRLRSLPSFDAAALAGGAPLHLPGWPPGAGAVGGAAVGVPVSAPAGGAAAAAAPPPRAGAASSGEDSPKTVVPAPPLHGPVVPFGAAPAPAPAPHLLAAPPAHHPHLPAAHYWPPAPWAYAPAAAAPPAAGTWPPAAGAPAPAALGAYCAAPVTAYAAPHPAVAAHLAHAHGGAPPLALGAACGAPAYGGGGHGGGGGPYHVYAAAGAHGAPPAPAAHGAPPAPAAPAPPAPLAPARAAPAAWPPPASGAPAPPPPLTAAAAAAAPRAPRSEGAASAGSSEAGGAGPARPPPPLVPLGHHAAAHPQGLLLRREAPFLGLADVFGGGLADDALLSFFP